MFKKIVVSLTVIYVCIGSLSVGALTLPLDYQYDKEDKTVSAPRTYEATAVYYGTDLGVGALNNPSDIFVAGDTVYVADTGNNRIIALNSEFWNTKIIDTVNGSKNSKLSGPEGIFYKDGLLFICDTGNQRAFSIDDNNNIVNYITGESIIASNSNFDFQPAKVVTDSNQDILIVSSTTYQGILRFSQDGEFKSFFAPNQVEATFETFLLSLLKSFFTDEMKEGITKQLPSPYSNMYIADGDFIYATSKNVASGQDVKCLNPAGTNTLTFASVDKNNIFGDRNMGQNQSAFIDIHCDADGNILVAEQSTNRLFLYDKECNNMAIFGGSGTETGRFSEIVAIEKLGNNYLILDKTKGSITVFSPTAYMNKLLNAMKYYQNGEYNSSEELWLELLEENSNLPLAYCSLGRAQYHLGEYKQAMEYLEKGGDTYFYSLALNGYRKEVVHDYFAYILGGGVLLIVGLSYGIKWIRKKLSE